MDKITSGYHSSILIIYKLQLNKYMPPIALSLTCTFTLIGISLYFGYFW